MTSLDFDELHRLVDASLRVETEDELIETVRGLLRNAYERAVSDVGEEFEFIYLYYPEMLGIAMEKETEGLTWEQRIRSWYHGKNPNTTESPSRESGEPDTEAIQRVVETDYHRMYNTGAYDTASAINESGRKIYKRWVTMGDEKVRTAHQYLEGDVVELGEEFYTWDGDSALFPGDFSNPAYNVNCRCILEYETA